MWHELEPLDIGVKGAGQMFFLGIYKKYNWK